MFVVVLDVDRCLLYSCCRCCCCCYWNLSIVGVGSYSDNCSDATEL